MTLTLWRTPRPSEEFLEFSSFFSRGCPPDEYLDQFPAVTLGNTYGFNAPSGSKYWWVKQEQCLSSHTPLDCGVGWSEKYASGILQDALVPVKVLGVGLWSRPEPRIVCHRCGEILAEPPDTQGALSISTTTSGELSPVE